MYYGRKFVATLTRRYERRFGCVACGFESDVAVLGVGKGEGNSPFFSDDRGASERAHENAERASERNADVLIQICPCPECGHRNWQGFVSRAVLGCVAIAGSFAGLGWYFGKRLRLDAITWTLMVAGLLGAAVYYWRGFHVPWTTAKQRVAFRRKAPAKRRKRKKKPAASE